MSYTPTTWVNGDIITATKLNNIESGVQSVSSSYTPTTWATGDIITAVKLNNIEQGIANAGGGSSDFSTATMTVTYWEGGNNDLVGAYVTSNGTLSYADVPSGGTAELALYKGKAMIYSQGSHPVLSTSGNIEYDSANDLYIVTGDCSITLGDYE